MGVDKSYGSGYKNTGLSKAAALKPGRLKKTAPAVAKARTMNSRNAATSPSMTRDKYDQRTVKAIQSGVTDLTGFNSRDGVDLGDVAALGLMIPAGIAGGVARAAGRLIPAGVRVARAATRVSRVARGTRYNIAEPLNAARRAVTSELDNVGTVGRDAYSNYAKMERRLGSGATDMLYGSEGKYIQRAKDAAYVGVNTAAEKATRLERLAERAAGRSDAISAADEIKRRLAALRRANKNR